MNYVKKMCILRQIKPGFSADGKTLSGLIKVEQYGKNLAVEVSIINFAPLVSGEYYCLLSDGRGKTEMLSLRGKSIFNILSDIDVAGGFCGIICYIKNEVVPIAYGINGNGSYNWRAILNKALPPVFPKNDRSAKNELAGSETPPPLPSFEQKREQKEGTMVELREKTHPISPLYKENYDDEAVATKNYYEEEKNERVEPKKTFQDENITGTTQTEGAEKGTNPPPHGNAAGVFEAFNKNADGYYLSVKRELDELFEKYPRDKSLCGAFSSSEWVRLKGERNAPEYLVGAVYEGGRVRYICYALAADDGDNPPEEIKNVCSFIPCAPLVGSKGFFVIFQSAASGECLKPPRG